MNDFKYFSKDFNRKGIVKPFFILKNTNAVDLDIKLGIKRNNKNKQHEIFNFI